MYKSKSRFDLPFDWGKTGNSRYSTLGDARINATTTYKNLDYWMAKYELYANLGVASYSEPGGTGYEMIEWSVNGKKNNNQCLHYRSRNVNRPFLALQGRYGNPNDCYCTYHYRDLPILFNPYTFTQMQGGIPTIDYLASRARAWHSMQPRFEGRVDVLNFLFELKDFRDIAKHIFKYRSILDNLRKISNAWRGSPRDLTRHRTKPLAALASANLTNELAIKPLMRDLATIFNQMNIIVREAQQEFSDNGSELQSSHFTEELVRSENATTGTYYNKFRKTGEAQFTNFTATLRYKYSYQMRPTVDAWMKYWGLKGSFNTMWNCMPFTFVVDYFVQIGNSIRAMEHDPNVKLMEYDYCESLKTRWIKGYYTSGDASNYILIVDGDAKDYKKDIVLSGLDASIYHRLPTEPYYGPAPPKFKLPSGQQAINIASLVRCLL